MRAWLWENIYITVDRFILSKVFGSRIDKTLKKCTFRSSHFQFSPFVYSSKGQLYNIHVAHRSMHTCGGLNIVKHTRSYSKEAHACRFLFVFCVNNDGKTITSNLIENSREKSIYHHFIANVRYHARTFLLNVVVYNWRTVSNKICISSQFSRLNKKNFTH